MFWKKTKQEQPDPVDDFSSFGNVLVNMGLLTKEDLFGLLSIQQQSKEIKIGELAIRYGFITEQQLKDAVELQNKIRTTKGTDHLRAIGAVQRYNIEQNKKTLQEKQKAINDLVLRVVT